MRRRYPRCRPGVPPGPAGQLWRVEPKAEPAPTAIPPGPGKVALLAARQAAREGLWHADDAAAVPRDIGAVLVELLSEQTTGIYRVVQGGGSVRFRAYPYRPNPDRRAGRRGYQRDGCRVHLGYFATKAEACTAIMLWRQAGMPATWEREDIPSPPRPAAMMV